MKIIASIAAAAVLSSGQNHNRAGGFLLWFFARNEYLMMEQYLSRAWSVIECNSHSLLLVVH